MESENGFTGKFRKKYIALEMNVMVTLPDNSVSKVEDLENVTFENLYLHEYSDQTRAYLKIQDGCNNFCALGEVFNLLFKDICFVGFFLYNRIQLR